MPPLVCDLDRTYAQRICRVAWQAQLIQASEYLRNGSSLIMFAPDYRGQDAVAEIVAEIRATEQSRAKT